jgi:hypothetical protein
MATTLSLRRLWTIYNATALTRDLSKRDLASTQLAFYSGARGVLNVLAYLIGSSASISAFGGGFSFMAADRISQNCSGSLKSKALSGSLGLTNCGTA